MRKIGETPLTGAQKQKRHRERIKARLAEASALREKFANAESGFAGFEDFYRSLLHEAGASAAQAEALGGDLDNLRAEVIALMRDHAEKSLQAHLMRQGKAGSSLLSRLAAPAATKV